jgi:deazaflavin-dependent oxidoreductase (nitroreductase family)
MDPRFPKSLPVENAIMKFFLRLGVRPGPVRLLTVVGRKSGEPRSTPVTPWTVDGHQYVIAGLTDSHWARNARAAGVGQLGSGRRVARVRLSEVTDAATKQRVVTSFGTENRMGGSFLVQIGVAPDRTPAGIAAASAGVAVFEVTPG